MIGAIAGDVIGSVFEGAPPQPKDFPLFAPSSTFTDDTVLTVAVANAILEGHDYAASLHRWGRRYPRAGYGGMFYQWLVMDEPKPYNSYGNGSAMRVAPVGWAFDDLDRVLLEAGRSAAVTHDHPEGVKGAQAVAGAVFLARSGRSKDHIRALLTERFDYELRASLDELRERAEFDVTCRGTVTAAAIAFLESTDYEDAIRNAISLGGDADTLACVTGALAEPFYGGTPAAIQREVVGRLDAPLREEVLAFTARYGVPSAADLPETEPGAV